MQVCARLCGGSVRDIFFSEIIICVLSTMKVLNDRSISGKSDENAAK